MTENQVRDRARELEELQEAVQQHASLREDQPEFEVEQQTLQRDFQKLLTPLAQRRGKLEAAKAVHQFFRDLADEIVCTYIAYPNYSFSLVFSKELLHRSFHLCSSALGEREVANSNVRGSWQQSSDCSTSAQEEPSEFSIFFPVTPTNHS